jgi:hypothetical protein
MERIRRVMVRNRYREHVVIMFPRGRAQRDGFMGRVVAVGIPPRMEEIA